MGLISRVSSRTYRSRKKMYKPPTWVNKSPHDLKVNDFFLEVQKNKETVDKIDLCDKAYYTIGRNTDICDITADHASISRVHAAIIFHPKLKKFFLQDNGSAHGTFIGKAKISREPKSLSVNACLKFGASTRYYFLRKGGGHQSAGGKDEQGKELNPLAPGLQKQMKAGELPEDRIELDLLTEKNTQLNLKQAANLANLPLKQTNEYLTSEDLKSRTSSSRPKKRRVSFPNEVLLEQVINIHEIDAKIGQFSGLVNSTEIVDQKKLERANEEIFEKRRKLSFAEEPVQNKISDDEIIIESKDTETKKNNLSLIEQLEKEEELKGSILKEVAVQLET